MKQHTLKDQFTFSGKGLHTGLQLTATFFPAEPNTGIRICRCDLQDCPTYEAVADYVSSTDRGTVLQNGDWKVSTIEHAMSALYAMNVDNCLIEVNGPEIPILDGSAKPFVEAIEKVGIEEQDAEQKTLRIKKKLTLKIGNSHIQILPDDTYSLEVHIAFPSPILSNQFASLQSLDSYIANIAPARTFCFLREVQPLLKMGLIKGGDLRNALVIYDQPLTQDEFNHIADTLGQAHQDASRIGYLSPLLFENEPARHKLLDLIGDLALVGARLQGKVIATCPGHGINTAFAKEIRKQLRRTELFPPVYNNDSVTILDSNDIIKILPHRYPMLLVDKIISMGADEIVGVKNFTASEHFFQGHFPKEPVVPGVLLIEAMAQTGGILVLAGKEQPSDYNTYIIKVDNAKFRRKVVPGDALVMQLRIIEPIRRGIVSMQAYAYVDDKLVAEALLTAQINHK